MTNGWYKMYRGWMVHPAFRSNDDRIAWLWLIENAAVSPHTVSINGNPVQIQRGEFSASQRFMAEALGASRQNIRTLIAHFEKWELITCRVDNGQSVIRVNEYVKYQDNPGKQAINPATNPRSIGETVNKYLEIEEVKSSRQPTDQPEPNQSLTQNNKNDKKEKKKEGLWFDGQVIRLNKADYEQWKAMYPGSDEKFFKFLSSKDDWLAENPDKAQRWFYATGKQLASMMAATE